MFSACKVHSCSLHVKCIHVHFMKVHPCRVNACSMNACTMNTCTEHAHTMNTCFENVYSTVYYECKHGACMYCTCVFQGLCARKCLCVCVARGTLPYAGAWSLYINTLLYNALLILQARMFCKHLYLHWRVSFTVLPLQNLLSS